MQSSPSGMVPAYTLRQENADLREELGVHKAGLARYIDAEGLAWSMAAADFKVAIELRMRVYDEEYADAVEVIWREVLSSDERERYSIRAIDMQRAIQAWNEE